VVQVEVQQEMQDLQLILEDPELQEKDLVVDLMLRIHMVVLAVVAAHQQ
jgi:hypothetical protein